VNLFGFALRDFLDPKHRLAAAWLRLLPALAVPGMTCCERGYYPVLISRLASTFIVRAYVQPLACSHRDRKNPSYSSQANTPGLKVDHG